MTTETTPSLAEVIGGRRELIRDLAPCEDCGATYEACLAERGTDPAAPDWFGCCATGLDAGPCIHIRDQRLTDALLDEIAAGNVRPAAELRAELAAARAKRESNPIRPDIISRFGQGEWWRQKTGDWILIEDMADSHRINTAAMVLRTADKLGAQYARLFEAEVAGYAEYAPVSAADAAERESHELTERITRDPERWMKSTPLFKALVRKGGRAEAIRLAAVRSRARSAGAVCAVPDCGCTGKAHA